MTQYIAAWSNHVVKWRNLTWAEYKKIEPYYLGALPRFSFPLDVYLWVYNTVKIEGPDPEQEFVPAGIVIFIAEQQLKTNPFNGTAEDIGAQLAISRHKLDSSYLETAKCLVAAAFKYSFEEMEHWDPVKLFDMIARAEKVLGKLVEPAKPDTKKPQEVRAGKRQRRQAPQPEVQDTRTYTKR